MFPRFHKEGFSAGLDVGRQAGIHEGWRLGWQKGSAIGSEVGCSDNTDITLGRLTTSIEYCYALCIHPNFGLKCSTCILISSLKKNYSALRLTFWQIKIILQYFQRFIVYDISDWILSWLLWTTFGKNQRW